jgi:hypothetical protein
MVTRAGPAAANPKASSSECLGILTGSFDAAVAKGIRDRYLHTAERKKHADEKH